MTTKELNDKLFRIWISHLIILPILGIIAIIISNYTSFKLITLENNDPYFIIPVFIILSIIILVGGYIYIKKRFNSLRNESSSLVKAVEYKDLYYRRVSIIAAIFLFSIALYNSTNLTVFIFVMPFLIILLIFEKPMSEEKLEEYLS